MKPKTVRIDAWSPKEDRLLVDVVLANIRTGQTQLDAFDVVGEQLGRTASACGFRWNSILRKLNMEEYREAKRERIAFVNRTKGRRKIGSQA